MGEYKGMVAISLNTGGKMAVWDSKNNRDPSSRTPFILDITDTSVADIVGITETKLGPKQARDIDKLIKMEGRPSVAIHATTSKATSAVLATDDTLGGTTVREGGVSIVIGPRLAHLVQDWETLADGRILVVYLSCREDWWNDPNTVVVVCFYGVSGATTKDKKSVASEVGAQLRKIVGDNEGRILVMMGDSNNVVRSADRTGIGTTDKNTWTIPNVMKAGGMHDVYSERVGPEMASMSYTYHSTVDGRKVGCSRLDHIFVNNYTLESNSNVPAGVGRATGELSKTHSPVFAALQRALHPSARQPSVTR